MARRKGPSNYKQVVTGTKAMGSTGEQILIAKITKLSPTISAGYLNNVIVACQQNNIDDTEVASPFTIYLSNSEDTWEDDQVITGRATAAGGGTVSLSAKRTIRRDFDTLDASYGPVFVWAEVADSSSTIDSGRFTVEAWGRMVILEGLFD